MYAGFYLLEYPTNESSVSNTLGFYFRDDFAINGGIYNYQTGESYFNFDKATHYYFYIEEPATNK